MKRNLKSILAITLSTAFTLTFGVVTVFAEENVSLSTIGDVTIIDTVLTNNSTFFLLEDGTLWSNVGDGNFVQIYENVKSVSSGEFSNIFIILEDDTLLYGNIYQDYDPSLEEVAKDVKSATGSYRNLYILKNDNTVWHSGTNFDAIDATSEVAFIEAATTETVSEVGVEQSTVATPVEETPVATSSGIYSVGIETIVVSPTVTVEVGNEFTQIAENGQKIYSYNGLLFIIDNNDSLWVYGADDTGRLTQTPITSPKIIMNYVADIQVNSNEIFIQDTLNNLYTIEIPNLMESSQSIFDKDLNQNKVLVSADVESIDAIDEGYLFIKEDGSLWANGQNFYYNLGFDSLASTEPVKVDDNVEDVYSDNTTHTIYLKEDGTYWGMGDNSSKQLGYVPYTGENFFDESGKYFMMSDVSDMDLTYDTSAIIKTDGSLWQLGEQILVEPPTDAKVTKIADDVSFASGSNGTSIAYVTGENKDLYFTESYAYLDFLGDDEEAYIDACLKVLESLGFNVNGTDKYNVFESIVTNMTEEEANLYKVAFDNYIKETYGLTPAASGVIDFEYFYYLDTKNNLYHLNFKGDDEFVTNNVKDYAIWGQEIYVVDTNNNLLHANLVDSETIVVNMSFDEYTKDKDFNNQGITSIGAEEEIALDGTISTTITFFREKDSYDFEPTTLKNIAEVNAEHYGFSVLGLDGVLSIYKESHEFFNVEGEENAPTILVGGKSYYLSDKLENIKNYDMNYGALAYVTMDDELWVVGSNYTGYLGDIDVYGQYIEEPVKFMDNIEKVVLGTNNSLILTTNNDLYGMGQNASGQLGFEPQGYTNKKTTVILPTELDLNFVTE